ncbi:hypothetical protein ABZ929_05395 [Streptomyces physcomitrii]|uniref:Uncharacterized protein n=2 Tax=Streptomyces TaxID=1883 RepID=A0A0B5EWJ8_STRA4|nr:hypothetical protein SLNWT_3219 [Streptomyces albus]AOU77902.1 hypothetical protein SLNHY_3211 [Streptomyces albus]AYN33657.1 hypothetical protein DUI70_3156 [Streptomyces albus]
MERGARLDPDSLFIYIGDRDDLHVIACALRQEPILMSDSADLSGAEQASPCCAAIAELRLRVEQRGEQRMQEDGGEDLVASSSDPVRDA